MYEQLDVRDKQVNNMYLSNAALIPLGRFLP